MKIPSLYISNGNRYIEGISHRLSVTSQARLFESNKKLKSSFSHMRPMKGFVLGKKGLELKKLNYHNAIGRT